MSSRVDLLLVLTLFVAGNSADIASVITTGQYTLSAATQLTSFFYHTAVKMGSSGIKSVSKSDDGSSFLTKVVHIVPGRLLEKWMSSILAKVKMPESLPMHEMKSESQKITIYDGKVSGVDKFEVPESSQVQLFFDTTVFVRMVVPVTFPKMTIFFRFKKVMNVLMQNVMKEGDATSLVKDNLAMLSFSVTIHGEEKCFLTLIDVQFKRFGGVEFDVTTTKGPTLSGGLMTETYLNNFFHTNQLRTVIMEDIGKELFFNIPKVADRICDHSEHSNKPQQGVTENPVVAPDQTDSEDPTIGAANHAESPSTVVAVDG